MFKKKFIKLCNERGESPSYVCRKVNIAPATFSCWNDDSIPRQATLQRIADYFEVDPEYLLSDNENLDIIESHDIDSGNMFWKNFVSLCNNKSKSPNGVCADLGLSVATATKWKKGAVPRDTTLKRIADYFGVTVEYFFTANSEEKSGVTPSIEFTEKESRVIFAYRERTELQPVIDKLLDIN